MGTKFDESCYAISCVGIASPCWAGGGSESPTAAAGGVGAPGASTAAAIRGRAAAGCALRGGGFSVLRCHNSTPTVSEKLMTMVMTIVRKFAT